LALDPDISRISPCPEHEVLLTSLRLSEAKEAGRLRAALSRVTDWDYLPHAALQHGVFPTLYHRLTDDFPEAAPPEFLARLRGLYQAQARRNLRIVGELLKVLELFESEDIPAIPIKGPVLAAVAYGDITRRQMVDLDILVRPKDLGKAKDLLLSAGYRPEHALTKKQEQVQIKSFYDFSFIHPKKTKIELHWRLLDHQGGGPDAEAAFERRVLVPLEGKTVFSLAPDDLILLVCLHASFHFWLRLSYVMDVARLVQAQGPLDWPGLVEKARILGIKRRLLLGLSLARVLLRAPVPDSILAQAEGDPTLLTLRRRVLGRLFEPSGEEPGLMEKNWFHVRARERLKDQLTYVWSRVGVPNEDDWRWCYLPDHLYWLYFAVRPLRITAQYLILPCWRLVSA
jgi:hypothetical protein